VENLFSEKFYRVLESLSQGEELSQRELAQKTGLSLGMVNLILKRLVKTGYVKVANLNRKKMEYILTSKGLAEKMVRSYQYFRRAYRAFQESRSRVDRLVSGLMEKGHRRFFIVGAGEVVELVEMAIRSRGGPEVDVRRGEAGRTSVFSDEVVLDCRLGAEDGPIGVSVLEEILNVPSGPARSSLGLAFSQKE
jgi:predicted transcriptional regulator